MKNFALMATFVLVLTAQGEANKQAPAPPPDGGKPLATSSQEVKAGESYSHEVESTERGHRLYPSNWGTVGLFRVRSAEAMPAGAVSFGIGGEFYSTDNVVAPGSVNTIAEMLFVGYALTDRLSLGLQRRNSSTTYGTPSQLISSLGDFNFTGHYSIPVTRALALAPVANILIASDFNNLSPSGRTLSAGLGLLGTFSLYPATNLPLFLHANVIYHSPQVSSGGYNPAHAFYNFSRFHTVTLALGGEFELGDFVPFFEWWQPVQANSTLGLSGSPSSLSVGLRVTPLENKGLALLLGSDIGVIRNRGTGLVAGVPFTPGFQIIGQASYTFGLTQSERRHYKTTADVNVVNRRFVLNKNVNFKVASAVLESSSNELLDQIADVAKKNEVKKLLIVGHTDSSFDEDYNLKLSLARANTVKKYLAGRGIAEDIMMTQGYGKRKPKATNLTEEGRQLNRRVEFFVVD